MVVLAHSKLADRALSRKIHSSIINNIRMKYQKVNELLQYLEEKQQQLATVYIYGGLVGAVWLDK